MDAKAQRAYVRELAKKVAYYAALPRQEERRNRWRKHNGLQPERPLVLVFPEGAWKELVPDNTWRCEGFAHSLEFNLKMRLYTEENIVSDYPCEGYLNAGPVYNFSGWGLEPKLKKTGNTRGCHAFEPVINSMEDLEKITQPHWIVDEQLGREQCEAWQDLAGDILEIRPDARMQHFSAHITAPYLKLRGVENFLLDLYEERELFQAAVRKFLAGYIGLAREAESNGWLTLNNDITYHNSGGVGYTDELPGANYDGVPRLCNMWGSAESQEFSTVSPRMHWEFALQYEKQYLEMFALSGYGCCEPLDKKLDYVKRVKNIRRISISPFADVRTCAEQLGPGYVFSWKPQPSHIVGGLDEEFIRKYIRNTVDICKEQGCHLEIILKDTHTCENVPERFTRWSQIAMEEANR